MDKEGTAVKPKRNAPLWVKLFVPFHILAITIWALPYAPAQFLPNRHYDAVKQEYINDPPRVPLRIGGSNPGEFLRNTSQFLANEPLVLNQMYGKDSFAKFYLMSSGFWQFWDMFSPNPANTDVYADADITYADGTHSRYAYPRMYELGITEKYLKERYRKFFERAGYAQYSYAWPIFAARIARLTYKDKKNPPTQVNLHVHKLTVAGPGEPQPTDYSDEEYFRYVVKPADLAGELP